MGVFGAVVEPAAFPVLYFRHHLAPGGHIALQFIGDDRTWYILQALQQLSEEALRGFGVAPLLYQDIEANSHSIVISQDQLAQPSERYEELCQERLANGFA
jgi:hypothetical protein